MRAIDNLSGRVFGILEVLEFDHMKQNGVDKTHGMSYYRCRCKKCDKEFLVARSHLISGRCKYHRGECKGGDS